MTDYAIRITRTFDEMGTAIERIASKCKKCVVYQHEGSRPHCHLLLVECQVSTDTLKNYLKAQLGVVDKSDWSFKKCQENYDKYITYMSKGIHKWSYQKEFEEKFLEEKRAEWKDKAVESRSDTTAAKKKAKKDCWEIILEVRSQLSFKDTLGTFGWATYCEQTNEQIYDIMIKKLEENKIRAADYELKRWLHTIVRGHDENLKRNILKSLV